MFNLSYIGYWYMTSYVYISRYCQLLKKSDGEDYELKQFKMARVHNFRFYILTQSLNPSKATLESTYPIRLVVPDIDDDDKWYTRVHVMYMLIAWLGTVEGLRHCGYLASFRDDSLDDYHKTKQVWSLKGPTLPPRQQIKQTYSFCLWVKRCKWLVRR